MPMSKKKKRNFTTILLLLLVLIFVVAGYGLLKSHNDKVEQEEVAQEEQDTSIKLQDFEAESIVNISVESAEEQFLFVKKDDNWVLDGEEEYPLSQSKLTSMAAGIAQLSATRLVVEAPEDLSEYGLLNPSLLIKAVTVEGKEYSLQLGEQLTTDTDYYGQIAGDNAVYVIPMATRTKYAITKADLFDIESPPSITADTIREVKVSSKTQGDFHIVYEENNPEDYSGSGTYCWVIPEGYANPMNMDNTAVSEVLSNYTVFSFTKGIDYVKENQSKYGLGADSDRVFVRYLTAEGEEKTYTLWIGDTDSEGNYYVRPEGSNRTYLMAKDTVEQKIIIEDKEALLSKFTHMVNILDVNRVTVLAKDKSKVYEIKRTDETDSDGNTTTKETFYIDGGEAEDTQFRTMYQSMIGLRMVEPLKEKVEVSGDPVLTLTFEKNDGKEVVVSYHPYQTNRYTITVNGKTSALADKSEIDSFVETILN